MIHDYHTQYNNKKVTYQFSKYGSLPFLFPFQHSGSKKLSWMSSIPFLYFTLVISSYLQVAMAADWWISWIFKAICLIIINKFQVHQEKGIQVVSVNYIQLHWKSILIFHMADEIKLLHTRLYVQWVVGILYTLLLHSSTPIQIM